MCFFLIEFYNLEIAWVPRSLTCFSVNISVVFRISCFKMHDVLLFLRIVIFVEHLYCQALCKVLSWTISFNFFYNGLRAYTRYYYHHYTARGTEGKCQSITQDHTANVNTGQNRNLNLVCMNPESIYIMAILHCLPKVIYHKDVYYFLLSRIVI